MKTFLRRNSVGGIVCLSLAAAVAAQVLPPPTVLEVGPYHRVWQQFQLVDLPGGGQQEVPTSVTEIATGLNVFDPDNPGQWRPAVPAWEVFDDGIVARQTQTRVILAHNLNRDDAFDALTPSPASLRLVGHPVSLGVFDPVTGQQMLLAEVQDSAATLAASNVIVFPNCLRGIRASIRYTIRRAGLSQDLLLEERLALPDGFSERSRLELYTEFDAATPPPVATVRVLRRETDPMVRAVMAEPDLTDTTLRFGDVYIGPGRAYALNRPSEFGRPRVVKSWIEVNRRPVLVEAVEWRELEPLLAGLPPVPPKPGQPMLAVNRTRRLRRTEIQEARTDRRPRESSPGVSPASPASFPFGASTFTSRLTALVSRNTERGPETRLAANTSLPVRAAVAAAPPAVLIDFNLSGSYTNQQFTPDTVWRVVDWVWLRGVTTLWGGSVIKFDETVSASLLQADGQVVCRTDSLRPVTFTSANDNTIGGTLSGSTGNPGVAVLWTSTSAWSVTTTLASGPNVLTVTGHGWDGAQLQERDIGDYQDSITVYYP